MEKNLAICTKKENRKVSNIRLLLFIHHTKTFNETILKKLFLYTFEHK